MSSLKEALLLAQVRGLVRSYYLGKYLDFQEEIKSKAW